MSDALVRDEGRPAALAVYALYLLSIPSLALFAPVGVVLAWLNRDAASDLMRAHFRAQVRLFAIAFLWGVALFILSIPAWALTVVLIGFPLLWLIGLAGLGVMIWFTVKSLLGLLRLMDGRMPY
jgi:uncharacterized membrane protein